ncbi:TPA: DegT/DnrJ/EryC1/StrS family aminotransferase, partial [Escherichia coli]
KKNDILARRYFYPLITNFKEYREFQREFPFSEKISNSVICLPIHNDLTKLDLEFIVNFIKCNANAVK